MTQQVVKVGEYPNELEHYGVPGMKWGKRKIAASRERNASIDGARARQSVRSAEIRSLTAERISTTSVKGKSRIDQKIADKQFELKNNDDAVTASQLKTGEKVMKGAKIAGMLGLAVVGLGAAASIINTELNRADNADGPVSLRQIQTEERLDRGERVSLRDIKDSIESTAKIREQYNK